MTVQTIRYPWPIETLSTEEARQEGRAEGLREAWHILVQVSHNGGTLTEAIQSVHWRWCEAASEEG